MKKIIAGVFGLLALSLAACTEQDVKEGVIQACGFVPSAKLITGVIKDVAGAPPGAGVAITVAQAAIDAICEAVKKKEASNGRAYVLVQSTNITTGAVTLRTLSGQLVSRH